MDIKEPDYFEFVHFCNNACVSILMLFLRIDWNMW